LAEPSSIIALYSSEENMGGLSLLSVSVIFNGTTVLVPAPSSSVA
jgi:hypothetical protein